MPQTSLDIVVKARDEATDKIRRMGGDIKGATGGWATAIVGAVSAYSAMRAVTGFMALNTAQIARDQAAATGSAGDMLAAEAGVGEAVGDLALAIPGLGPAAKAFLNVWYDTEGMKKQAAALKQLERDVVALWQTAIDWQAKTRVEWAETTGASATEVMGIVAEEEKKKRDYRIRQAEMTVAELRRIEKELAGKLGPKSSAQEIIVWGKASAEADQAELALAALCRKEMEASAVRDETIAKKRREIAESSEQKIAEFRMSETERENAATLSKAAELRAQIMQVDIWSEEKKAAAVRAIDDAVVERELANRRKVTEAKAREAEQEAEASRQRVDREIEGERAKINQRWHMERSLDATLLDLMGQRTAASVLQMKTKYGDLRTEANKLYADDEVKRNKELAKIELAERLEEREIRRGGTPRDWFRGEIQTMEARFLTRAPGREETPAWAGQQLNLTREQINILKQIADKTGVNLETVSMN